MKHTKNASKFLLANYGLGFLVLLLLVTTARLEVSGQTKQAVATGQSLQLTGYILSRDGDNMDVRDISSGNILTVVVTGDTSIKSTKGAFGFRKKSMDATSLIPGLRLQIEGTGNDSGQLVAEKIVFDTNSLNTAQQSLASQTTLTQQQQKLSQQQQKTAQQLTEAQQQLAKTEDNLAATQQQLEQAKVKEQEDAAKLNKRVSDLDDYDTKSKAMVYFAVNSYHLGPEGRRVLTSIANNAKTLEGYMIEVLGFADMSGSEARNQWLSQRRSAAVVQYLEEVCHVPVRRILTPTGMGTTQAVASNDTSQGRALNRRVEVLTLVNKGITEQ